MKSNYLLLILLFSAVNIAAQDTATFRPYKKSCSFQVVPGLNSDGWGFDGKLIACYGSPKARIGAGIGIASYKVNIHQTIFLLIFATDLESEDFEVSLMPVFFNFSLNLNKKLVSPFITMDMGMSYPLTGKVTTQASYAVRTSGGDTPSQGTLKITNIKPGFYFDFIFGIRGFFNQMVEGGASIGFDLSSNIFEGEFTASDSGGNPYQGHASFQSTHISGGLIFNIMGAIHLPVIRK